MNEARAAEIEKMVRWRRLQPIKRSGSLAYFRDPATGDVLYVDYEGSEWPPLFDEETAS